MKVLLTGGSGQLGSTLIETNPKEVNLLFPNKSDFNLLNKDQCFDFIEREKPDWIINAGAFTNVEEAESNIDNAFSINYLALEELANKIKYIGCKLIQISTDYVFDGLKNNPYETTDKKNPKNVYGLSKSLGENVIINSLKISQYVILRTSWVLSPYKNNFLLKILNLMENKETVKIVNDQFGCMTSTYSLAKIIWIIINNVNYLESNKETPNIFHWCDEGTLSWYELANFIRDLGIKKELIKNPAEIIPVSTNFLDLKAERPKNSVLDCSKTSKIYKINQTYWKDSLNKIMETILEKKSLKNNL